MGYAHSDYISDSYHSVDSGIESLITGISALGKTTSFGFRVIGSLRLFRRHVRGVRAAMESFLYPPFDVPREALRAALAPHISEDQISRLDEASEATATFIDDGDRLTASGRPPLLPVRLYYRYRLRPELVKLVDTIEDLAGILELAIGEDGDILNRDEMVSLLSAES